MRYLCRTLVFTWFFNTSLCMAFDVHCKLNYLKTILTHIRVVVEFDNLPVNVHTFHSQRPAHNGCICATQIHPQIQKRPKTNHCMQESVDKQKPWINIEMNGKINHFGLSFISLKCHLVDVWSFSIVLTNSANINRNLLIYGVIKRTRTEQEKTKAKRIQWVMYEAV